MKVYIGRYKNWFGPYQLAEKLMFWLDKDDDRVFRFGEFLAHGRAGLSDKEVRRKELPETRLYKFLQWIESKRSRNIKIKIDYWDTWSMDHTLALIALPMLKQLKEKKHGSQIVDLEDVPEYLRGTTTEDYFNF